MKVPVIGKQKGSHVLGVSESEFLIGVIRLRVSGVSVKGRIRAPRESELPLLEGLGLWGFLRDLGFWMSRN